MKIRNVKTILAGVLAVTMAVLMCSCNTERKKSAKDDQQPSSKAESSIINSSGTSAEEEKNDSKVPEEWQDGGIFSDYYEKAYELMEKMTIEEKVGQMILARCPEDDAYETAKEYHLGGYVLFDRDFIGKSKDDVARQNNSYLKSQSVPMIIAVDEEGGTVSRLSGYSQLTKEDFRSPRELFEEGGLEAIKSDTPRKSLLLSKLKINTNLAPVCDISTGQDNFMYERSLGQNATVTSMFVTEFTKISQENNVSATLKHFPGYGNNTDTHEGIAIDKRTYETFKNTDLKPFKAGIDAGAHMVLVSHNIVECMDSEYPASLSPKIHDILRNDLGFTGIIVTDDLEMGAIREYSPEFSPVVTAVLAGNDMLCVSDIDTTYELVLDAVHKGNIETKTIDHAVMRILAWKYAKGLLK